MLKFKNYNIPESLALEAFFAKILRDLRADFCNRVIIYGCGELAKEIMLYFAANGIEIDFFVDDKTPDAGRFYNYDLYSLESADLRYPVVVATDRPFAHILRKCLDAGVERIYHCFDTELTDANVRALLKLRKALKRLNNENEKYCIWGAGRHSCKIYDFIEDICRDDCLFASENQEVAEFCTHKVCRPEDIPIDVKHVIISSDAYERAMYDKRNSLFSGNKVFHRLYDENIRNWKKLRSLVRGSRAGILLGGKSISGFVENAGRMKDLDLLYCSMNEFWINQRKILDPVGKKINLIIQLADFDFYRFLPETISFLKADARVFLITKKKYINDYYHLEGRRRAKDELENLKNQIIYFDDIDSLYRINSYLPKECNTLFAFLFILTLLEPKSIILFGADGMSDAKADELKTYYCDEARRCKNRISGILKDTLVFNEKFQEFYTSFCKRLLISPPEIINCSPGTFIRPFKEVTYYDMLAK